MATAEIPAQMKAAAFDRFGSPEVVHLERVPVPELGARDVLVEVGTAGVGSWDPWLIEGSSTFAEARFPQWVGSDGAGTVRAIGDRVTRFAIGDQVYGSGFGNAKGGFFAEYAAIDENELARIPETIPFDEAGALAMAGLTALQGLDRLGLVREEPVMILGASGAVGHVAVQLAKRLDLRVFAVAAHDDGVALADELGADEVVEGHHAFVKDAREFAPTGFAGALVFAGARGWEDALELVARGRRVAWPNGVEPEPITPPGVKRIVYDAEVSPDAFDWLGTLVARGPFHVHIARSYALGATAQALEDVQRHHVGRLAIKIH
jgi:NADPH:quinone reductase-like Zn-dependent oxidoreductase